MNTRLSFPLRNHSNITCSSTIVSR